MNRQCFNRAILAGSILLWSSSLAAFSISPPNHQNITEEALSATYFSYELPNGTSVTFGDLNAASIAAANRNVDIKSLWDEETAEHNHFDDERFSIGQNILKVTRHEVVQQLRDPAFRPSATNDPIREVTLTRSSRKLLGEALHTLQDYYSHTNWVEKGNTTINPSLGVPRSKLHEPAPGSCDENNPAGGPLTSGDYLASGISDCLRICDARPNKCAHGNVLRSLEWAVLCPAIPSTPGILDCGLNKDRSFRRNHQDARSLAKEHTRQFISSIFTEALAGSLLERQGAAVAICQLMGVPDERNACTTKHALQVQRQDNGGSPLTVGTVRSEPAGIDCGATCSAQFIDGTPVTLTASDAPPWIFVRWGTEGACAGSSNRACTVEVSSDQTARAVYAQIAPQPLTLSTWARSCWLQTYQNNYSCPEGSLPNFHDELRVDYGGGEVAYIIADGVIGQPPGVPRLQSTMEGSAVGQWFSRGGQRISATYFKNIRITSNTLPPLTPVTVRATFIVELAHSLDVTLSEPPFVQWSAQLPYIFASVQAGGVMEVIGLGTNGGGPTGPVVQSLSRSVDVTFDGVVGGVHDARIDLVADLSTIQAARAYLRQHRSAQVSGPYLIEVNGLDVQFVGN